MVHWKCNTVLLPHRPPLWIRGGQSGLHFGIHDLQILCTSLQETNLVAFFSSCCLSKHHCPTWKLHGRVRGPPQRYRLNSGHSCCSGTGPTVLISKKILLPHDASAMTQMHLYIFGTKVVGSSSIRAFSLSIKSSSASCLLAVSIVPSGSALLVPLESAYADVQDIYQAVQNLEHLSG